MHTYTYTYTYASICRSEDSDFLFRGIAVTGLTSGFAATRDYVVEALIARLKDEDERVMCMYGIFYVCI
jgi:hypothetical protein